MTDALLLATYLIAYAGVHSLLASWQVKRAVRRGLGHRFRAYRIIFVTLSLALLAPLLVLPRPQGDLYRLTGPVAWFLLALQAVAALGFLQACRQVDLKQFLGLAQVAHDVPSGDLPADEAPRLVVDGLYRRCRHPLYFFGSLFLLAQPQMSILWAVLTTWAIAYFWIGSIFEERRLRDLFGSAYVEYAAVTPRFLPAVRLPAQKGG